MHVKRHAFLAAPSRNERLKVGDEKQKGVDDSNGVDAEEVQIFLRPDASVIRNLA